VQDLVAERVTRALSSAPSPAMTPARAQVAQRPTSDLEAYELYLKGRYWAFAEPARAEEFYRRAIARDPRFAAAWAAIADSWLMRGRYGNTSPRKQFDLTREAALKAVALDPNLADGHAALGQVYADHDWDWGRAERELLRALELNPNSDRAHGQYAYLLTVRRDFDGALEHVSRTIAIDPVSPTWALVRGWTLDCSGRHEEAIRHLEETLRLHPRLIPALLHLGIAYTNAGKPDLAITRLDEALASIRARRSSWRSRPMRMRRRGGGTRRWPSFATWKKGILPHHTALHWRGPRWETTTARSIGSIAPTRNACSCCASWRCNPATRRCARIRGTRSSCGSWGCDGSVAFSGTINAVGRTGPV
jgi:tetratricopeptide (TPR) repeat protein